jgi:hypothetical protein
MILPNILRYMRSLSMTGLIGYQKPILPRTFVLEGGLPSPVVPTATLSGYMPSAYEDSFFG